MRPTMTIRFNSKFQIIAQLLDSIQFKMKKKHYSHSTTFTQHINQLHISVLPVNAYSQTNDDNHDDNVAADKITSNTTTTASNVLDPLTGPQKLHTLFLFLLLLGFLPSHQIFKLLKLFHFATNCIKLQPLITIFQIFVASDF